MNPTGEVLHGFLNKWITQSWDWKVFPSFGSIVCTKQEHYTIIGIVADIQTGSFDQSRVPFAYQKTIEELEKEQPQIFSFLTTQYTSITLGFIRNSALFYQLPPEPIKIHSFVSTVDQTTMQTFFSCHRYLPLIFSYQHTIAVEDLLLSLLQQFKMHHLLTEQYVENLVENIYHYLGSDYKKLKYIISRIEQEIENNALPYTEKHLISDT